jgi:hypothetical protein
MDNFKLKIGFAGILTLCILLTFTIPLFANDGLATEKVMQIMSENKDKGFVNVRGERRGFLSNQGVLKQRIKLLADQSYLAVIGGDKDVEVINLIVQDRKGNEITRTTGKGQTFLNFKCPKKDKYKFVIEAPKKGGYYHFSLVTQ